MTPPNLLLIGAWPEWDMRELPLHYTVHHLWEAADKEQFLKQVAPLIRAVGTRGDLTLPASLIAALPKLEIIACHGVGVDGIDLAAARARGIKVTNTPDVLTGEVADLALMLMLAVAHQLPQAHNYTREGRWTAAPYPLVTRMWGKRLGIVGMGRIGQAIAKRAAAFDMQIAYHSRSRKADLAYSYYPTASELAAESDFLVAATSGGQGTAKLINAEVLRTLGPHGFFINVARGTVADEEALLQALETKAIAGAGLDVFLNEPAIDARFLKLDNVVLQPHMGSATVETRKAMGQLARDNLAAHFARKPLLTPVV